VDDFKSMNPEAFKEVTKQIAQGLMVQRAELIDAVIAVSDSYAHRELVLTKLQQQIDQIDENLAQLICSFPVVAEIKNAR
jgi:hypothetical protein